MILCWIPLLTSAISPPSTVQYTNTPIHQYTTIPPFIHSYPSNPTTLLVSCACYLAGKSNCSSYSSCWRPSRKQCISAPDRPPLWSCPPRTGNSSRLEMQLGWVGPMADPEPGKRRIYVFGFNSVSIRQNVECKSVRNRLDWWYTVIQVTWWAGALESSNIHVVSEYSCHQVAKVRSARRAPIRW